MKSIDFDATLMQKSILFVNMTCQVNHDKNRSGYHQPKRPILVRAASFMAQSADVPYDIKFRQDSSNLQVSALNSQILMRFWRHVSAWIWIVLIWQLCKFDEHFMKKRSNRPFGNRFERFFMNICSKIAIFLRKISSTEPCLSARQDSCPKWLNAQTVARSAC